MPHGLLPLIFETLPPTLLAIRAHCELQAFRSCRLPSEQARASIGLTPRNIHVESCTIEFVPRQAILTLAKVLSLQALIRGLCKCEKSLDYVLAPAGLPLALRKA